jgi:hypothetical protein
MADDNKQLTVPDFYFINSEGNFNDLILFILTKIKIIKNNV